MRTSILLSAAVALAACVEAGAARAADQGHKVSGPHVHKNLAVYFLHGPSAPDAVPLTLAEALAAKGVRVIETGNVNALQVENIGKDAVFIQSGDIVKGGQQDRVLTVSLLLPPGSGKVAIDSFCVEQGRWTARGKEDVKQFASASHALPSREAKLAMKMPAQPLPAAVGLSAMPESNGIRAGIEQRIQRQGLRDVSDAGAKQRRVWDEVSRIQDGLSSRLGGKVNAAQSETSLQLALENEKLATARLDYVTALEAKAAGASDIVGFVFAIDGKINSADVYPSAALFKKMWPKLLAASVTEALATRNKGDAEAPAVATVDAFLKAADTGKRHEATIARLMKTETVDAERALYVEARTSEGKWVHRNYLAK